MELMSRGHYITDHFGPYRQVFLPFGGLVTLAGLALPLSHIPKKAISDHVSGYSQLGLVS